MLRTTFAGHSFELIGCDTMHNADKFLRFPHTDTPVDCRIEVIMQDEYLRPVGELTERVADWRIYRDDEAVRFYHRQGTLMVKTDDLFTQVTLTFCSAMPMIETIRYLQVQHMIACYLLCHGASLIHSAGLEIGGNGVLLCGRSGVGKSTMARRLCELEPQTTVLSEDMPAATLNGDTPMMYGTPLCGDDEHCGCGQTPLRHIVVLRQATQNRIVPLSTDEAIFELLTVVPQSVYAREVAVASTDMVMALVQQIPVVCFENDGTENAAHMLLHYLQTELREHS